MKHANDLYKEYLGPRTIGTRERKENLILISKQLAQPIFKGVIFHLPFALMVPDGFSLDEPEDILLTNVKVSDHPNHLFEITINDEQYKNYLIDDSIVIQLLFSHRLHMPKSSIQYEGLWVFSKDNLGKLSHTVVCAQVPIEKIQNDYKWDSGLVCDLVIDAVNRFVEHYKVKVDLADRFKAYIPNITTQMIMHFKLFTRIDNNDVYVENFIDTAGAVSGALSEEMVINLKNILLTDKEPDLFETYKLRIENRLSVKDWRSAIIESAIMFESWIQPIVRNHYLKILGSNNKVNKKLSFKDSEGTNHPMPMSDILRLLIEDAFGFAFQHTVEYKDVTSNTITPRNKIVHGGEFKATEKTANTAYLSALAAIEAIKFHVPA